MVEGGARWSGNSNGAQGWTSIGTRWQREANRLHKVLQDAGIKLASVATNILSVSGRAMLEALVGGTTAPEVLAELARGKLRAKLPAQREAVAGRFRPHHAFLVTQALTHLDYLDEAIDTVSTEVERLLSPFAEARRRSSAIPGIKTRTAEVIIAEIGVDMSRFPSEHHLASWAGLCPGNNESAGKHKAGTTRKGNRWLRMALIEIALAAIRTKDAAFGARYRRVMRHRVTRRPSWRSPTACSGPSTMCWRHQRTTKSRGQPTAIDVKRPGRHAAPWLSWNVLATASPFEPAA